MAPTPSNTVPFFVLTFAITWGLQLPGVLAQRGLLPGDPQAYLPFAGLGIFGPLVAATIVTRREGGREAVRALYRQLLRWRVHPGWYAAALLVPAALLSAGLALLNLTGRAGPVAYLPPAGPLVVGLVISLAEEVGWRGYAQPRLQERFGDFAAAGIIGVVWCFWHIPMLLGQGVSLSLLVVMIPFFIGGSLFFAWLKNGTRGSLLLVVLAHWGAHLNNSHRALPDDVLPLLVHTIVYAALGLVLMRSSLRRPLRTESPSGRPSPVD